MFRIPGPGILEWVPTPRISIPGLAFSCSCCRSTKWAWDQRAGAIDHSMNSATCASTRVSCAQISPRSLSLLLIVCPQAGPMLILLSANRNLENPRPGIQILGMGPAKMPGMGFKMHYLQIWLVWSEFGCSTAVRFRLNRGIVAFNFSPRNLTQVTSAMNPGKECMVGFCFGKEINSSRRVN